MKDKLTVDEMASLLPGSLATQDDARSRLLGVLGILIGFTDSDDGLTASEIRDVLERRSETGHRPSEPSILSDIAALSESGFPFLEIQRPGRGESGGFKCTKAFLTNAQVQLLINIVRTCRFISLDECNRLCESLESLVSVYQQDRMVGDVYVDERPRPSEPDVYQAAEIASQAIEQGKKISFAYSYYALDGKERLVATPEGRTEFHETPISLIYSNGNYYLETWPETVDAESSRKHFSRRLDRIRNPRLLEEAADANAEIDDLKRTVPRRISETFDMFGDGIERHLFLKVNALASDYAFARFGHGCRFENISTAPDGTKYGYLLVSVQLSPTFYRWLCGLGTWVEIVRPKDELWVRGGSWAKHPAAKKSYRSLLKDYEAAVEGYVAHLKKALSPYES